MNRWLGCLRWIMVLVLGSVVTTTALAADDREALLRSRIAEVVAVMRGTRAPADTFDARFLAEVPPDKLRALSAQLVDQGGALEDWTDFRREQAGSATFTLRFAHGTAPARIELNPAAPGLVSGFRIFGLTPAGDTLDRLEAEFAALPGKAGFAVYRLGDGAPALVGGRNADKALAVGSSFKLYVLAALVRQVKDGARRWDDVVPVSGKSFPGGTVHTLPDGAPVTLHTLASLMIAISDNSATDMLVRLVGQEALAREVRLSGHARPDALAPMLTTAQLFALKRGGAPMAARYAKASPAERARLLAALDLSGVAQADPGEVFGHGPVAIDSVEWFASSADLAGVMDDLRRFDSREALDILAVNPAMDGATGRAWSYVGYKGGSEDGVISMTWLLRGRDGAWKVVTGSWNDARAPVDNQRLEMLMRRLAKVAG
ncbi:serine hydrolase [Novosphingobium kaempferiae]|uniref:serine hydrolase n=1 Tax=Novosphingobium kaempferiae TaxID=2896849 RepID=UPI001E5F048B|nr:serine hydrolase [Novosphingobium kaempferiae]